jgi:hypothetical protein
VEQADPQRHVQKGLQECQYIVVYPNCLAPTSSNMKTQKNTEGSTEPANEGDIKMKYSSDWMYSPSIGAVRKIYQ